MNKILFVFAALGLVALAFCGGYFVRGGLFKNENRAIDYTNGKWFEAVVFASLCRQVSTGAIDDTKAYVERRLGMAVLDLDQILKSSPSKLTCQQVRHALHDVSYSVKQAKLFHRPDVFDREVLRILQNNDSDKQFRSESK